MDIEGKREGIQDRKQEYITMTPFLIAVMELLPFAIKAVEHYMDSKDSEHDKRTKAIKRIMKEFNCSENKARCANEIAVNKVKESNGN